MRNSLASAIAAAALAFAGSAAAAPIIQNQQNGTFQILFAPSMGQTFTAEDATVSIGFWVQEYRPDIAPAGDSLTITLREGEGAYGAVLGSVVVGGLTVGHVGWIDADFSHIALDPGSMYTAIITDTTWRWAVSFHQGNATDDAYAGGGFLAYSALQPWRDARFRVLPVELAPEEPPIAVAEPASAALFGLGFGLVAIAAHRRRRRQ